MRRVITTGYECYLAVGARRERAADHADRLGLRLGALRRRKESGDEGWRKLLQIAETTRALHTGPENCNMTDITRQACNDSARRRACRKRQLRPTASTWL